MPTPSLRLLALAWLLGGALQGEPEPSLFLRHCARCHGADGGGRGTKGERLPGGRINDPARLADPEEDRLQALILEGRKAMPGFKAKLSAADARKLARQVLRGVARNR